MDTAASSLNIFKALEHALPFSANFAKRYWILGLLLVLDLLLINWRMVVFSEEVHLDEHPDPMAMIQAMMQLKFVVPYLLLILGAMVIGYFILYYAIRMACSQLAPSILTNNKHVLLALWQLFCMSLLLGIASIPLFFMLVIPCIWWAVKTNLAAANIICTEDGTIQSIKKSFQFTNNNFWRCFGYLLGTFLIIVIAFAILMGIITLIITIVASVVLHLDAKHDLTVQLIYALIQGISSFFQYGIIYFCQAWLFVHLKSQNEASPNATTT